MPAQVTRFMQKIVTLAKKAVVGEPEEAVQKGEGGYADWVIIAINGLREFDDYSFRQCLDRLQTELPVCAVLGVRPDELPHYTCLRPGWRS